MQERTDGSKPFAYNSICKGNVLANAGSKNLAYRSKFNKDSPFVYLERVNAPKFDPVWKIHISILNDAENLPDAWNLVKEILTNYGIDASKVLRKDCYFPEFQLGKEITIYDQPSRIDWSKLVNDITVVFNQHHIKPGFAPINDMVIKGSHFMSFRCDLDENEEKVSSLQAQSYKPPHLSHDFEKISIEPDIANHQPSKPKRQNEQNIKNFYTMLERNLINTEELIFSVFPVNYLRSEFSNIGDELFYRRIVDSYINTNLISTDDFNRLKENIAAYEKLIHEFNYRNFNITNAEQESYLKQYAEYERKFFDIQKTLKSLDENIQTAQETLSNTGSVVEKGSTPGSPSPPLPSSPKGYAHIQQVLAAHPVGSTVISGQDRMIIEIGNATNLNSLEIDDALEARTLTSEHIKNIYNIIKSREHICDVIREGLEIRSLTLDQVKNITPEILTRLSTVFERELHSRILTPQIILQKLESFKKESEASSAHVITAEMSSSSSLKPPGQK